MPDAKVDGQVGRARSFEVKVNDVLVHSKLKAGAFPDFEEVVEIAEQTSKGAEPTMVRVQ